MGWKFISGQQADEKTKVRQRRHAKGQDLVRFIVGAGVVSRKFDHSAIVKGVATFLKKQTEGMSKQDIATLEASLHAEIAKVLR